MKKINLLSYSIILLFTIVGLSAQAQSRKAYIVKDGATLFETEITGIDSIQFVPATFFTVTYHANGESVTVPAAQKVLKGSAVNVAAMPGYDPNTAAKFFIGWNTKADGSGGIYTPGAPLKVNQNIDFYAGWVAKSGGTPDADNTVKLNHYQDPVLTGYCLRGIFPGVLPAGKIEANTYYNISYSFTSDVPIENMLINLVDASKTFSSGIENLSRSAVIVSDIQANTPVSGSRTNHVTVSTRGATNESELANSILFTAIYQNEASSRQPTLTITSLTVEKADVPTLVSVGADGEVGRATTQLILFFDRPTPGLTINDIKFDGYFAITKKSLTNVGAYYVLNVTMPLQTSDTPDNAILFVYVNKSGSVISGAKEVLVYVGETDPEPEPPSPIVLVIVAQNGKPDKTTTELTFRFTEQVPGLTAADITLTGITVRKGVLSNPVVSPQGVWSYTLPIDNFTTPRATLGISLPASKGGRDIDHRIYKTVDIFYYKEPDPEDNYDDIEYKGFLGRGYNVLNSPYYVSHEVKMPSALNMPKLVGQGKVDKNRHNHSSTDHQMMYGETMSQYTQSFNQELSLSGGIGLFKASVGFSRSGENSIASHESFANIYHELVKEQHSIDMSSISTDDLRNNYLNDNFETNWLLNSAVTPDRLFEEYGTHIFLTLYLGGRMNLGFMYHNHSSESSEKIQLKLSASYATVKGEATAAQTTTASTFASNSQEYIKSWGGSVAYDFTSFASAVSNYRNWASSIEYSPDLALVKGGKLGSLTQMIPIWELIDPNKHPARRNQIKKYFDDVLKANGDSLFNLQAKKPIGNHIYRVYMGASSKSSAAAIVDLRAQSTSEMHVVAGDLSTGASGDFIHLGYTETTNPGAGVCDLKLWTGDNPPAELYINGKKYHVFGYNVNKGSDNKNPRAWLYALWMEDSQGIPPLKDIVVEIDYVDQQPRGGDGWEKVQSTSGGAANFNHWYGRMVYVWMKR